MSGSPCCFLPVVVPASSSVTFFFFFFPPSFCSKSTVGNLPSTKVNTGRSNPTPIQLICVLVQPNSVWSDFSQANASRSQVWDVFFPRNSKVAAMSQMCDREKLNPPRWQETLVELRFKTAAVWAAVVLRSLIHSRMGLHTLTCTLLSFLSLFIWSYRGVCVD